MDPDTSFAGRLDAVARRLLGGPASALVRVRAGDRALDDPATANHLWRTTLAKLAIDRPRYPRLGGIAGNGERD